MPDLIRFFLFYFFVLGFSVAVHAENPTCALQTPAYPISVDYINDGDTLTLEDNKRVRIIGINAPELGYDDKADQPLAVRARERLRSYLKNGRALVVYDKERRDKYGRILAHVFNEYHGNVGAALIREGLGFALSIPPNLRYRECYLEAQRQARHAKQGVWSEPYFNPIAADQLKQSGFNRVYGCIQKVRKYRNLKYFHLSDHFRLSVAEENQPFFNASSIVLKKGLCLVAAGWVYKSRSYRTMKLLHPDAVQIIHPVFKHGE